MNRESITFDTANSKIVVRLTHGDPIEYTSAEAYLNDWPDRADDCVAMGWQGAAS